MKSTMYEMDASGKLVEIKSDGLFNDLPVGQVIEWDGNQGWVAEKFAIVKNLGISQFGGGALYDCISLKDYGRHRFEAHSIKLKDDPKLWHSQHVFICDGEMVADIDGLLKGADIADIEKKRLAEEKQAKKEEQKKKYISDFPFLKQTNKETSNHTTGSRNIKKELSLKWPLIKFSVKSDYNSIDASWTDGPKTKEVEAIISKYEEGSFDGMTDSYNYNHDNVWPDVFGGAKYVNGHRHISLELAEITLKKICAGYGWEYKGLDHYYDRTNCGRPDNGHRMVWTELEKDMASQ